jgi:hypothetical protein
MATNTAGDVARDLNKQLVHYLRKTINYNDALQGNPEPFAALLPAGSQILFAIVNVVTAFNGGASNVIKCGTATGSYADVVAGADVSATATGSALVVRGSDLNPNTTLAADTQLYAEYTYSSTAPTAGQAVFVVCYVPNNDQ